MTETGTATESEPVNFDLTCWHINQRYITEPVGLNNLQPHLVQADSLRDNYLQKLAQLSLFTGKDVLHGISSERGGAAISDGNKNETGKVQEGIIRYFLSGNSGRTQVQSWLPAYARLPTVAYTTRGGTGNGDIWKKVAPLFESVNA
jgi:hypothetical protein